MRAARALDVPVISVGNLTMGGTGKTPCVLRLAELLRERGRKPGILTRGYGRKSPVSVTGAARGRHGAHRGIRRRAADFPARAAWRRWASGRTAIATGTLLREQFGTE